MSVDLQNSLLEKQAEELNYQLEDDQRSYETALNDRDSAIRKIRGRNAGLYLPLPSEQEKYLNKNEFIDVELSGICLMFRRMPNVDGRAANAS